MRSCSAKTAQKLKLLWELLNCSKFARSRRRVRKAGSTHWGCSARIDCVDPKRNCGIQLLRRDFQQKAVTLYMTVFCTHCGAELSAESSHCTQCGSAVAPTPVPTATGSSELPTRKKDRRWLWWVPALILFFALGFWLALLLAPKCPSCKSPATDGAGSGPAARAAGSTAPGSGTPDKPKNGSGQAGAGPAEGAGGSSTGEIEGSGKIIPHEFAGKEGSGNSTGRQSQDGDPTLDPPPPVGGQDPELYGAVAQLAQGVAPYGVAMNAPQPDLTTRSKSSVAYDFTYDKTGLPRYPDNVREVASSISYLLDSKTGERSGPLGTGAGIVTSSSFDEVVDWYRKNLPGGWQSSSIGDFAQLAQPIQGPGGDLMKLLKGEMPGAAPSNGNANPAAPKVRVALFKAPVGRAGSPDSTIMIIQKEDKPVSIYLQSQVQ